MATPPSDILAALRATPPLVQCITNYVAMNYSANVLLAVGASPAMVHTAEESGEFAAIASALTVNIGTLSPPWVQGMTRAIAGARGAGRPWILDPVAHFATPYRAKVAQDLLALSPTVVRGNASEILSLAGAAASGKGADSGDDVSSAEDVARQLAVTANCVVAVTGEVDFVTDGTRAVRVSGGSPFMPNVTATGCALTCMVGACVAASDTAFDGTVAALSIFAQAGTVAGAKAEGPGSFAWRLLDALAALQPGDLSDDSLLVL